MSLFADPFQALPALVILQICEDLVFIRLRRRPRALPVDECVTHIPPLPEPRHCCFGGFRHRRITLRSRDPFAPQGLSAGRRRRVCHGGTTGSARGAPLRVFQCLIPTLPVYLSRSGAGDGGLFSLHSWPAGAFPMGLQPANEYSRIRQAALRNTALIVFHFCSSGRKIILYRPIKYS